jgi:hypothetical protein
VTGTWGVRGDLVTIDGDEYMKVRQVNMLPEVGDMQLYASNLFTGNDDLSECTHLLFNWTSVVPVDMSTGSPPFAIHIPRLLLHSIQILRLVQGCV